MTISGAAPTYPSSTSSNYHYWVAAFVVVLFAMVVGGGLFFAAERAPHSAASAPLELRGSLDKGANNDVDADGVISSPLGRVASARLARGAVDKDLDNDENPDGIAHSLIGLAPVLLCMPSLGGCLLLCLSEVLKRGSKYHPTLERPG